MGFIFTLKAAGIVTLKPHLGRKTSGFDLWLFEHKADIHPFSCAAGCKHRRVLETGKVADFVVHDAEDYRELAYFFGGQCPAMVFVGGESLTL